jgi:hypothetical protein
VWNISASDFGLLVLVGIVTVGLADIIGAMVAGQHRDVPMNQWDAAHGFGTLDGKAPPRPLKHRARGIWKRTYTSRTIAMARAAGRSKAF